MALLTREQILKAEDRTFTTVEVPEWGGEVRVGSMTALQRDRYLSVARKFQDDGKAGLDSPSAIVVAASVVDQAGELVFQPEDILELQKKNAAAVSRVFDAATAFNKLKSAEQVRGNS